MIAREGYILRAALLKGVPPSGLGRAATSAGEDRSGYRLHVRLSPAEMRLRLLSPRLGAIPARPQAVCAEPPPARLGERPAWTDPPEA